MDVPDVQRTKHFFLTVHAAVTPTSVFPAPKDQLLKNYMPDDTRKIWHLLLTLPPEKPERMLN